MDAVHETIFVRGGDLLGVADGGWRRLLLPLLPVVGALCLIPLANLYPGEVYGYRFAAFLERVNLGSARLRFRNLILKTLGPALTIGTGGSAGVEGPIAQIGGTVGSQVGQLFRVSGDKMRVFVAAGSAGAIAATFNAPIAGVMFAMEIILLGNYELRSFAAVVVASGISTVVSRSYYGESPEFPVPFYDMVSPMEIPLYLLLGLLLGALAVIYIKVFYRIRDAFDAWTVSPYLKPVVGAALVGLIGVVYPQVMGNGYHVIEQALEGHMLVRTMIALVFLKILATSLTLGSGGAGGVFAPALLIGAMAGGGFGSVVHGLFPAWTAGYGAYAAVGIGAFLSAATHAPLTGIFLLFELTGNYQIIIPIMFAAVAGTTVARRLDHDSIDTVDLTRKGIDLHSGRESTIMGAIKVREVMNTDFYSVHEQAPLTVVIDTLTRADSFYLPVVNNDMEMVGIVSYQDIKTVLFEEDVKRIVRAGSLATEDPVTLHPEDSLNTAAERLARMDLGELPVVDPDNPRKVLGMVARSTVVAAYQREVLRWAHQKA